MPKVLFCLFVLTFLSACSLAPLSGQTTARSIGKHNWSVTVDLPPSTPAAGIGHGLTNSWDLGVSAEIQFGYQVALWTKYALLNNEEGFSMALYAGGFTTLDAATTDGFFGGPVLSYKHDWIEPFLSLRYNTVHWTGKNLKNENDNWIIDVFKGIDHSFYYYQGTPGLSFWVNKNTALSVYVHSFYIPHQKGGEDDLSFIPGIGASFRF
jgi:hypothetical protein